MIRHLVVDTSVLVSGLISSQRPGREVLRRCLREVYRPLISNALFLEYEDVTKRTDIRDACPLTAHEIADLLHALYSVCRWVPVYYLWRPNIRDEGDNYLIELALAGNASEIVTNNIKDFKNAELSFPGLRVITPEELLRGE